MLGSTGLELFIIGHVVDWANTLPLPHCCNERRKETTILTSLQWEVGTRHEPAGWQACWMAVGLSGPSVWQGWPGQRPRPSLLLFSSAWSTRLTLLPSESTSPAVPGPSHARRGGLVTCSSFQAQRAAQNINSGFVIL